MSHPKDKAFVVKYLAHGHECHEWDWRVPPKHVHLEGEWQHMRKVTPKVLSQNIVQSIDDRWGQRGIGTQGTKAKTDTTTPA